MRKVKTSEREEVYSLSVMFYGTYGGSYMPDNTKRGTFRSYTFFVHANNFHAYNITFVNSSGFGTEVGQAIAVYAEGDNITFKNCKLLGHQDTLFTGPLPLKESIRPEGTTFGVIRHSH